MAEIPLITPIRLPIRGLDQLQSEAQAEGYKFLESLVEDWESGKNRFEGAGELLCGCMDGDVLVAVGGLSCDPYASDSKVGRIRRIYVREAWRNRRIGTALVTRLVEEARRGFTVLRLRAENEKAARLYQRLGFVASDEADATHVMRLGAVD